jgi:hypothetical protein
MRLRRVAKAGSGGGQLVARWAALLGAMILTAPALSFPAEAESAPGPAELLRELNELSLDPDAVYRVRDVHLTRDRVNLYLNYGTLAFYRAVSGQVTGVVFEGEGEILLVPPSAVEKRSLAHFTKSPILTEPVNSAILRFTDETAQEILERARPLEPDDEERPGPFLERWDPVARRLNPLLSVRVLMDLLGERDAPYFHAQLEGKNLGLFFVTVDERQWEGVQVGAARALRGRVFGDVWCSFPTARAESRFEELRVGSLVVNSYRIETRIHPDHSLEAKAELELKSRSVRDRVHAFELSRSLKVSRAVLDGETELPFFQDTSLDDSEAAARGNDWLVVVLPAARPAGERFRLSFEYQGNVITEVGKGVLYVGSRGSWYPNRGVGWRANYDLTFHCPKGLTLVATGNRVEEKTSGEWKTSRWVSEGKLNVAGFNLGTYVSRSRRVGKTHIEVFAGKEAERELEKRHAAANPQTLIVVRPGAEGHQAIVVMPRIAPTLDPTAHLDEVAEEVAEAVGYFETLFGPFPYPRLSVAQAPGHFGQGWPGLVYLPTLSFLASADRSQIGMGGRSSERFNRLSVTHEIAHQWWGNLVGWATYRDQWLSEGFATYAAALHLAQRKDGEQQFRELMRTYRDELLAKTRDGGTVEAGGPIWLGHRQSSSLTPDAYVAITYKKACWVIHMLRGLMSDPQTGSDERFFRMLREFVAANAEKAPSTDDFLRHAEKYMTREMDLERNGRLDWFFNSWVYSTGIPSYRLSSSTRRGANGKFVVEGKIEQSGVGGEFEMLVPVVADAGRDRKTLLGRVHVNEDGGKFRFEVSFQPARVGIDEEQILAVVEN